MLSHSNSTFLGVRMRSLLMVLVLGVGFTGTAAAEKSADPKTIAAANNSWLVCKKEMVVGSHIPKQVCRTRTGKAGDRNAARHRIKQTLQRSATRGAGTHPSNPIRGRKH